MTKNRTTNPGHRNNHLFRTDLYIFTATLALTTFAAIVLSAVAGASAEVVVDWTHAASSRSAFGFATVLGDFEQNFTGLAGPLILLAILLLLVGTVVILSTKIVPQPPYRRKKARSSVRHSQLHARSLRLHATVSQPNEPQTGAPMAKKRATPPTKAPTKAMHRSTTSRVRLRRPAV